MTLRHGVFAAPVADHGGSLARARSLFPDAPEPWLDLSTGINPHSYPLFNLPATVFSRLPEPSRAAELAAVAADAYGAPSAAHVAPAPGTQSLLARVASLVSPGRALVLGPTYAEHVHAAATAGHVVRETTDFDELCEADLAIIVNPNNPDGRIVDREKLLQAAETMRARDGRLIVDEAFMDVGKQNASVAADVAQGGLVVLRSFGKFFGLAGIRLGFAIASEGDASRLKAEFGPWAVSGPALEYGLRALRDKDWQERMRDRLAVEAKRLDAVFARHGLIASGGTSLFRFHRTAHVAALFDAFGRNGILLRNFADRPDDLRIGLPESEADLTRIENVLSAWSRWMPSTEMEFSVTNSVQPIRN